MKYEKRVNMRIPVSVYELLMEIASLKDTSLSFVVREILTDSMKRYRSVRDCE